MQSILLHCVCLLHSNLLMQYKSWLQPPVVPNPPEYLLILPAVLKDRSSPSWDLTQLLKATFP